MSGFEVGKPLPHFCPACQAVPQIGYCGLAGCPTAPEAASPAAGNDRARDEHKTSLPTPTPEAVPSGGWREAVARIIDPQAVDWQRPWRQNVPGFYADENAQHRWEAIHRDEDDERQKIYRRRVSAFERADAILALPPQSSPWRLIESAPKDTSVLVWSEELQGTFGVVVARLDPDLGWQSDEVNFESYEESDFDSEDEDATVTVDPTPTHWMPLPLPPSPQAEGEGKVAPSDRHAFENRVKILRSIDLHELIEAGVMSDAGETWRRFRDDPVDWLIKADDVSADLIWALVESRAGGG